MIEHKFLETGRLWPVIGPDGSAVLFQSRDSAEMYAIIHGLETGEPMPMMKAVTLLVRRPHDAGRRRQGLQGRAVA